MSAVTGTVITMSLRLAGISTIPSSRANADISGVTSDSVSLPVG
jgi:hypothetical protein